MEQTRPFDGTHTYPAKPGIQIHHFSWALLGGGGAHEIPGGGPKIPQDRGKQWCATENSRQKGEKEGSETNEDTH